MLELTLLEFDCRAAYSGLLDGIEIAGELVDNETAVLVICGGMEAD